MDVFCHRQNNNHNLSKRNKHYICSQNYKYNVMKKILLLCLIALITGVNLNAQKIKENGVDKFTRERIIETSFEKIVNDKSFDSRLVKYMKNIWIAFRQVGDEEFLRLKWCTKDIIAIDKDAEIIFLDKDGNTYPFKNTSFTLSGEGKGTVGSWGSGLYGLNIYSVGDCSALEDKVFTDMRIVSTEGYYDFAIDKNLLRLYQKLIKYLKTHKNNYGYSSKRSSKAWSSKSLYPQ